MPLGGLIRDEYAARIEKDLGQFSSGSLAIDATGEIPPAGLAGLSWVGGSYIGHVDLLFRDSEVFVAGLRPTYCT